MHIGISEEKTIKEKEEFEVRHGIVYLSNRVIEAIIIDPIKVTKLKGVIVACLERCSICHVKDWLWEVKDLLHMWQFEIFCNFCLRVNCVNHGYVEVFKHKLVKDVLSFV